ncbi:MAG: DUF4845 domain-containing protein [Proteobacteria bacterium]|nr:DUF4845 domain-containing protein [Pseudomonadota bacterium]
MSLRNRQHGLTLMGFVIVLIVVGFFAYMAMRLIPMYNEYSSVVKSLDEVAKDPIAANAEEIKLRDMVSRHFETGYVSSIDPMKKAYPDGVVIKRSSEGTSLSVNYDAKAPLFYNVFLVAHFEHTATNAPGKPIPGG